MTDEPTLVATHRAGESKLRLILAHVLLGLLAVAFVLPLVYAVGTSLKPRYEVFSIPPSFVGSKIMWSNYSEVLSNGAFIRYILNSVFVSVTGSILVLIISALSGYAFGRLRWKGRDALFVLFLGTLMVPQEVIVVPMFILMQWFNWTNTYQGMILPFAFTAFGTFLMRQFYKSIPYELDEAAKIDGAGPWDIFIKVIFPLAKPPLAVLTVFTFLGFWNSYLWPLIIISDYKTMATIPIGLASFSTQYGTRWDLQMAAAIISMIPTTLLVIVLQKHLIKGIATVSGLGGR